MNRYKENAIIHLSKGNNYGEKSTVKCAPSRLKLPKGHTWTFSINDVNCPMCMGVMIEERNTQIAFLRRRIKEHRGKLDRCQQGFKIEVKQLQTFKPDPEILERIRAGI